MLHAKSKLLAQIRDTPLCDVNRLILHACFDSARVREEKSCETARKLARIFSVARGQVMKL